MASRKLEVPDSTKLAQLDSESIMYCNIHLTGYGHDKMFLRNFPPYLLSGVCDTIQRSWIRGIQPKKKSTYYEIKLNGFKPAFFSSKTQPTIVDWFRVTLGIFQFMLSHGWSMRTPPWSCQITSDLHAYPTDSYGVFFSKGDPEPRPLMCGISFSDNGKTIIVVDGSSEIIEIVRLTIKNHWHAGGSKNQILHNEVQVFKLGGRCRTDFSTTHLTLLRMQLRYALHNVEWGIFGLGVFGFGRVENLWLLKKNQSKSA